MGLIWLRAAAVQKMAAWPELVGEAVDRGQATGDGVGSEQGARWVDADEREDWARRRLRRSSMRAAVLGESAVGC